MKLFLLAFFSSLALLAAEKPNIATVNMGTVFNKYHRRQAVEKQMQNRIEEISTNPRVAAVDELNQELNNLSRVIRDQKSTDEERTVASKAFESISIEFQSLAKELQVFMAEEKRKATTEMVVQIEVLTEEVRAHIAKMGQEMGFDLVLEIGGFTSSQTSPILYLRDSTDITEQIISHLNADAPTKAEAPTASEAPSASTPPSAD